MTAPRNAPQTVVDFSRKAPEPTRQEKAKLLGKAIGSTAGFLLAVAAGLFVLLRLVAYTEGWDAARVSPLGAIALTGILWIAATLTKD